MSFNQSLKITHYSSKIRISIATDVNLVVADGELDVPNIGIDLP